MLKTFWCSLFLVLAGFATAAELKLDVQNPAIEKLQARMLSRSAKVDAWKAKGAIGEEMTGLLKQIPVAGQGLAEKKEIHDLIVAENEDRYALFRELILANNLQLKDLDSVGSAYAKSRRASAKPSELVQSPTSKEFVQKKDLKE